MKDYEINDETLAIIGVSETKARVVEKDDEYIVQRSAYEIIDNSCRYFGSSYEGRVAGSKSMLNAKYKLPIVNAEAQQLIFFPTESPITDNCIWISSKYFDHTSKDRNKAHVYFKNGKEIKTNCSSSCLNNQYVKATLLECIVNRRKNN